MTRKDLTGSTFFDKNGVEYVVTAGCENSEIAFAEKTNGNAPLWFCCDARILNSRLYGSYKVSYTVSKAEFFNNIQINTSAEETAVCLKEKYYKIPTVFLRLVAEMYLKERALI